MRFIGDIALDAEVRAIASGAITDGSSVVVNSDGTVSSVSSSPDSLGDQTAIDNSNFGYGHAVYDTGQDKILFIWTGTSSYGTAVVGTVSGNSISFGTPTVYKSANTIYQVSVYDPNAGKTAIIFNDRGDGNKQKAIVATVSGTSVSFGSVATFSSTDVTSASDVTFDSSQNKILVAYTDTSSSSKIIAGTISGTDISFGTAVEFLNTNSGSMAIEYDVNAGKSLVAYVNSNNSNNIDSKVVSLSGTSVSLGSQTSVHNAGAANHPAMTYDSTNNKIVLAFKPSTGTTRIHFVVATISGTDVSYGTKVSTGVDFSEDNPVQCFNYNVFANKVIFAGRDDGNSYIQKYISARVSGTSITMDTPVTYYSDAGDSYTAASTYDPDQEKSVLFYAIPPGTFKNPAAKVLTLGKGDNITSENYIGFAHAAYADGQKATVKTTGSIARNIPQVPSSSSVAATAVVFESAATKVPDVCFDSTNNRIVVAYQDDANSDYGTAIVGTVASDGSISFGTPVVFENAATGGSGIAIVHDSNSNKIVIAYNDGGNSNYGTAIVGTVDSSDNSISFGSATVFENGEAGSIDACFDNNSNKVVIAYYDSGNSQYGKAVVGTVSGTSISFGSIVTFESAQTDYVSIAFDSTNNKAIVAYADGGDSSKGKAVVGTVSGTDISFGTVAVFENADTRWTSLAHDSSNEKTVIAYHDAGNSDYPTAIVSTVSGTDISFGTPVVIQSTANYGTATTFDSNINKIIITYNDYTGKDLRIIDGTVSGTSISFGTNALLIEASSGTTLSGVAGANHTVRNVFDSNVNKTISVYSEFRNSSYGTAIAATSAGTLEDLTIGQQYFVQTDGTLGTSADSPSVIAGTAIGTSDLIVKG